MAVDIDGKNPEYLFGRESSVRSTLGNARRNEFPFGFIHSLPEVANGHFFLRELPRSSQRMRSTLHDINATDSVRKTVADMPIPGFDFLLTRGGVPTLAFGSDDDNRQIVYRRGKAVDDWLKVDDKEIGFNFQPLAFTPDEREVYAVYSAEGEPFVLVRQTTTGAQRVVLASDARGSINLLQWGPRGSPPFAASGSVGRPRLRYLDDSDPNARLHKSLSQEFPNSLVSFYNFSSDGQRLLFSVSSDRDPGTIYLYDRQTEREELLFSAMPQIDAQRMGERRPVSFKARDGLDLYGYITLPAGREAKNLPLILLPHGGPHGPSDTWSFDTDAQFLASRGYAVLQVNFRGSGGRGYNFVKSGFRQWGGAIQNDLIDGVQWAIDRGLADPARVCAYGASFGAYSAMMVAIRAPQMFKCAVGYAGVYDLAMMYDEPDVKEVKRLFNQLVMTVGEDAQELAQNSPARLADKLGVPVLLVHGDKDYVTPLRQAEAMRAALIKAKRPPEWMLVPDEGHGFYATKNQAALYRRLEAFLAKHLGS